jgi:Flp pilus assembly protein TadD
MAYQEAIRLNPDFPEWHLNLGCLYDEAGNTEQAIACWRRAIVLDENHTSARLNLSYALCVTGKPREAMDVLQEAAAREKQTSQLVRVAERIIELYRDYPEAFREEWEE